MKFSFCSSFLSLAFAVVVIGVPATSIHIDDAATQPAVAYPIGTTGGTNAKVAGRIFHIDGRVEYFAGKSYSVATRAKVLMSSRYQCMVACTSEQE